MRHNRFLRALLVVAALVITVFEGPTAYAEGNVTLTFSDTSVSASGSGGYTVDGTAVTITSSGTYTLTGRCSDGTVEVAKGLAVTLILDDLDLSSSVTAPVVVKKGATVAIHLEGSSTLTDNEADEALETYEGACIKVKSGSAVTFCGEGGLTFVANAKNGIKGGSTANLTFNQSGVITVTGSGAYYGGTEIGAAVNNGIACDGSIVINQGTFVIRAANDGIKSAPDATDEAEGTTVDAESAGTITINGGTFDIACDGDGIQADTALTIANGTFDIVTYQGSSVWNDNLSETLSCKGLKASGDRATELGLEPAISISGGTFALDCGDDAIHSDAYATVTGGTFSIATGDDGMHADTSLVLGTSESTIARDPDVSITTSYEGLEGGTVYIYSGRYYVIASDDGINAAGGSSSGSDPGHGGGGFHPGGGFGPGGGGSSDYNIYIYGGTVFVNCDGDGLDSNGGLYLYGGTQTVFAMQAGGDNSALDHDGALVIDGATIFTAGGAGMDGRVSSSECAQGYKAVTTSFAAGSVVSVTSGGTVVYSDTLPKRSSYTFYSSPSLDSSSSIDSTGTLDACVSNDWAHSWDSGAVSDGTVTYTCSNCGKTETQSVAPVVSVAACDHNFIPVVDEGYAVAFVVGDGASVSLYYTKDHAVANETGVTSAVSRNSDTGEPDSTGDGQVNFMVVLEDGYSLSDVSVEGPYKNLKDVSTDELPNTYRVTKVAGELTITVSTSAEGHADISAADVTAPDVVFSGAAQEPDVTVVLNGQTLVSGTDYNVEFADNIFPGTATVTVTGVGSYAGTATGTFVVDEPFCDVTSQTPHYEDILWLFANGISKGWGAYPTCEYRGTKSILRQDMAAFLYRMAGSPEYEPTEEDMAFFSDVSAEIPHAKEIWWLASTGISTGWSEADGTRTFRGTNSILRQDMAAFLYRLAGSPEFEATDEQRAAFVDVTGNTPHCAEIWWLASTGVSKGWEESDGTRTFRGTRTVIRQDMAAFLHRLDGLG